MLCGDGQDWTHAQLQFPHGSRLSPSQAGNYDGISGKRTFYRLCKETARSCWAYNGSYSGPLSVNGNSIEEVMGLTDKQKINRLRDENGGCIRLEWLKYAEAYGCKIPKKYHGLSGRKSESRQKKSKNFRMRSQTE